MKCLATTTLLLSAVAALGKKGHIEFDRSKLIVTLQDRQLGGSKSSKSHSSSAKSSKSQYLFAKSSKASHKATHKSKDSRDARDFEAAEGNEEVITTKALPLIEDFITTKTLPSLNGGIAKDYNGATYVGIIATIAILWN